MLVITRAYRSPPMSPSHSSEETLEQNSSRGEILAAQVRLLFSGSNVGVSITLVATVILGNLQ
jgi:hypothetical protein